MWTGVPVMQIAQEESERLIHMEDELKEAIVGCNETQRLQKRLYELRRKEAPPITGLRTGEALPKKALRTGSAESAHLLACKESHKTQASLKRLRCPRPPPRPPL